MSNIRLWNIWRRWIFYWLLLIFILLKDVTFSFTPPVKLDEIEEYRKKINHLIEIQQSDVALQYLRELYEKYKTYALGKTPPSFYNLLGVALYETNNLLGAMNSFDQAVDFNSSDLRAWINLVALKSHFVGDYERGIRMVEKLSGRKNLYFALRNFDWQNLENHLSKTVELVQNCVNTKLEDNCELLSNGLPYFLLPPSLMKNYLELSNIFQGLTSAPGKFSHRNKQATRKPKEKLIRIGFLLHRIDSGPVINLSHLLFKYLQELSSHSSAHLELYAFFLGTHEINYSYQDEILLYFTESISLVELSIRRCVSIIQSKEIDVLIEMNGWNSNTALLIMKERPAPIQISYLGDPITTGGDFIDYYIGDKIIASAESASSVFTEKLAFLPTCYLVNSHLDWQRYNFYETGLNGKQQAKSPMKKKDFLQLLLPAPKVRHELNEIDEMIVSQVTRPPRTMKTNRKLQPDDQILLGVYHNWNKMHPDLFQVWMNILHRANHCKLIFTKGTSLHNLFRELSFRGIPSRQVGILPVTEDLYEHYYHKTAIDLYLDTTYKNGHVTSLDTHIAAVPMVTLSFTTSSFVSARSTESILHYSIPVRNASESRDIQQDNFFSTFGVVYSLKEYEDHVLSLVKTTRNIRNNPMNGDGVSSEMKIQNKKALLLKYWKDLLIQSREKIKIFQTRYFAQEFAYSLEAMIELEDVKSNHLDHNDNRRKFHMFTDRG